MDIRCIPEQFIDFVIFLAGSECVFCFFFGGLDGSRHIASGTNWSVVSCLTSHLVFFLVLESMLDFYDFTVS